MNINSNLRHWSIFFLLFILFPMNGLAQTEKYELVVEKIDGKEISFKIINNYPFLRYIPSNENDQSVLRIWYIGNREITDVLWKDIKRLYTRSTNKPNAIEDVVVDDGDYQIYTPDGRLVETLQKGVNILRFSDGTTQKVCVK